MACDCNDYIDCGKPPIAITNSDESAGFSHSINYTVDVSNIPAIEYLEKTVRNFNVSYGWDRDVSISHIVEGLCTPTTTSITCDAKSTANPSSSCSEHCFREVNTPYYLDRQNDIFVYKNAIEELKWSVSSNSTAIFRLKFGDGHYHKILIPDSVKTKGTEKFVLVKNGQITILAQQEYEYNPFPIAEGGGATWGLYGNTIQRSATPDTTGIACILLLPNVPKQAIPLDNDVIAYGFYDYNAIEGGFVESSLPKDDGGKDYFYPYWCRQMPLDKLWRATADDRYKVSSSFSKYQPDSVTNYQLPTPTTYELPFGSFAVDSEEAFVYSCLLKFSDRCGGKGMVVNYSSFGDLYKAIYTDNKIIPGKLHNFYPVTPV